MILGIVLGVMVLVLVMGFMMTDNPSTNSEAAPRGTVALPPTPTSVPEEAAPEQPQSTGPSLVWKGCGISKKAFMDAASKSYLESSGVEVKLTGGSATVGIEAAATGAADIGGTCRGCIDVNQEDLLDLRLTIVAWDALVAITHPSNSVTSLTEAQLADILLGKIKNWSEIGGDDAPITVCARRGKTSGVGYMVRKLILDDIVADFGSDSLVFASSGPLEKKVASTPYAIAVTGVSSARVREGVKIMAIGDVEPTAENIGSGAYPYYRPLYVAHPPRVNQTTKGFVEWLISPDGQSVVESQGTVTLAQGSTLVSSYKHFENPGIITNYEVLGGSN